MHYRINMTDCFRSAADETKTGEEHEVPNIREENRWVSCCFEVDKRVVMFVSQLCLDISVIFFCMFQLLRLDNCEAQSLYSGILTFVVGVYLPNPKLVK